MILLVGLGNPGSEYAATRHNIGFMVVDRLAERWRVRFRGGRGEYVAGESDVGGQEVALVKPVTYMNLSGVAVSDAVARYGIELSRLLVIHDDIHLPYGKLRLRPQGSDGGHNGVASIIYHLGTEAFPRLRVGVGAAFPKNQRVHYVLSPFTPEEQKELPLLIEAAADAAVVFVNEGLNAAMNKFNPEKSKQPKEVK